MACKQIACLLCQEIFGHDNKRRPYRNVNMQTVYCKQCTVCSLENLNAVRDNAEHCEEKRSVKLCVVPWRGHNNEKICLKWAKDTE